ncbi:MAG TPA: hypothetical protein VK812_12960 [Candidatus Binatus sp.]|nr:hypothetical protein [Candidatus Binatus sp.]
MPGFSLLLPEIGITADSISALHRVTIVFYAGQVFEFVFAPQTMQRLTARLLLLYALIGTFVPLALAVTAPPPHSCCLRKSAHQCHQPASATADESDQRSIHGAGCCAHDCCRAVTTSQSADPQSSLAPVFAPNVESCVAAPDSRNPTSNLFASQSARAPPRISIA